jgi:hypothetical protein
MRQLHRSLGQYAFLAPASPSLDDQLSRRTLSVPMRSYQSHRPQNEHAPRHQGKHFSISWRYCGSKFPYMGVSSLSRNGLPSMSNLKGCPVDVPESVSNFMVPVPSRLDPSITPRSLVQLTVKAPGCCHRKLILPAMIGSAFACRLHSTCPVILQATRFPHRSRSLHKRQMI